MGQRKQDDDHSFVESVRSFWEGVTRVRKTPLRVAGDSMLPALPNGSTVVVQHTLHDIAPGTVIAYRRGGDLIIHRVVAVQQSDSGRVFLTKGDSNHHCDAPVAEHDVLGRVVAAEPPTIRRRDDTQMAPPVGRRRTILRRLGLP